MKKFQLGQNALDVCKVIVDHQPSISTVSMIAHNVGINWRQRYQTTYEKIEYMEDGFKHSSPIKNQEYCREDLNQLSLHWLYNLEENHVWSVISKVQCYDGKTKHLPLMNFHPENGDRESIKKALKYICGDQRGVLLDSGRFQHYYGDFLLDENEWVQFMSEFLMPTVVVSPRYVGHGLHDGFSTLRLTADKLYKPKIPEVVEIL
ncbi:hypothetical protein HYZ41_04595 [archaeon]|nr:hypothetical protein [archaeon]